MVNALPRYPFAWPSPVDQPKEFADVHRCPATRVELPSGDPAWLVPGYEHVRALLTDPRISKNRNRPDMARMAPATGVPTKHFQNQVEMDPPGHTRMRRLVATAFRASRVERLRPAIQREVDRLLDAMIHNGPPIDLSAAFAHPLSINVICDLLGVPAEDRQQLVDNSASVFGYMRDLIGRKRVEPGDDLISELIRVRDEDDGRLSETELHWWSAVLLLAGYETTANQVLSSVVLLLAHPGQLETLRADPASIPNAVEELLRHQVVGTSLSMLRYVTDDIELDGVMIPKGASVVPSLECANHDPTVFDRPDELNLGRTGVQQLTFSYGRHFCVGAQLGRIELQLALAGLLDRLPQLDLAVPLDALRRKDDLFTQGFVEVPVTW